MKQLKEREAKKIYRIANEYEKDEFLMSDAASVSSASLSSESEEEEGDLTHFFLVTAERLLTCKDEIIALQKKYIQALLDVIALKNKNTQATELDKTIARVSEAMFRAAQ